MEKLTRRQLFESLTVASAAGFASRAAAAPTEQQARSFKALSVNHFEYASSDCAKIRDWYADLLGLTIAYDDGHQSYMWVGDTIFIPRKAHEGEKTPQIAHLGYTLANYDQNAVLEEMKRRGLSEVSPNGGPVRGPAPGRAQSPIANMNIHFKDPEGYLVQVCSTEVIKQMVKKPADPNRKITAFKGTGINHISYTAKNYGEIRDFYSSFFDMRVTVNDGHQAYCRFGDSVFLPRNGRAGDPVPYVDHLAYTIENYDHPKVKAELQRRGIQEVSASGGPLQPPSPGRAQSPIANLSVHIKDPEGFLVQICAKNLTDVAEKNPPE